MPGRSGHLCDRARRLLGGAALVSAVGVLRVAAPWIATCEFTLCPWRAFTDHRCPFCGLTRALASGLRGDIQAATAFHPLWPLAAAALLVALTLLLVDGSFGSDHAGRLRRCLESRAKIVTLLLVVCTALRW